MTLNKREIAILVILGGMSHLLSYLLGLAVGVIVLFMGLFYFWYLYFREIKNGRAGEIKIFSFAVAFSITAVWIGVKDVSEAAHLSREVNMFFLALLIFGLPYLGKNIPPDTPETPNKPNKPNK